MIRPIGYRIFLQGGAGNRRLGLPHKGPPPPLLCMPHLSVSIIALLFVPKIVGIRYDRIITAVVAAGGLLEAAAEEGRHHWEEEVRRVAGGEAVLHPPSSSP